ncbi:MAG TPA: MmgE/PrpD family protein [Patescibacteria group bacterium]|nr:MmgE/PrpD family protein [Patescibacteria group bacterium]
MTVLEQMGEWTSAAGESPLGDAARELLALHLLDTVGAWVAGGKTEDGAALSRASSSPSSSLPLLSEGPLDRIVAGVGTTRLTEIDDIHMPSCTTPGAVVAPTALLVAARLERRDAGTFASALRAGYEVMTHLGVAVRGPEILARGIWPTYLAAPVAAAAVTGRLLGLDPGRIADALAMALTRISGGPGRPPSPSPRWLLLGLAARAGCEAALAAASGYAGDRKLLDDDWLARTHGLACDRAALAAPDEGRFGIGAVSIKHYCAAKQTIAAIDAFRELLGQGITPDRIAALRVAVPGAVVKMIGHRRAVAGRVERITSAPYHLALAAYRPEDLDDVARPNLANEPAIAAFMDRVEVAADPDLDRHYPERWPARVEAVLDSGERVSKLVLDARGDPGRPADASEIRKKFRRLAEPVIGETAAHDLEQKCLAATRDDKALASLCTMVNAWPPRTTSRPVES